MFTIAFVLFISKLFLVANPLDEFYQFGTAHSDRLLRRGDDTVISIDDLPSPLPFFGEQHRELFIATNGLISLNTPPTDVCPQIHPTGDLIAPFWADVDTTLQGNIWFRVTSDEDALRKAKEQLSNHAICTPLYLIIVTWDDVGYYRNHYDKTNTFQCVLATDGNVTFAIFLYKQNGIQWTTGDACGGTFGMLTEPGGIPAVIGIISNGTYKHGIASLSGTQKITTVWTTSNINTPGVWIFNLGLSTKQTTCTLHQESRKLTKPALATLVAVSILCMVFLLLWLGVAYGYFQVGRYIIAQRNTAHESLQEKLIVHV